MAATQPSIQNTFEIIQNNASSADWLLKDITNYSAFGLSFSQILGSFVLSSPIGIIHSNNNFASPDIDGSVADDVYSNPLQLSSNTLPVEGNYGWQYTIRVSSVITGVTSGTPGIFTISGNRVDDILLAGIIEITGSTGTDGIYSVTNAVYDGINDETNVSVANAPDATVDGNLLYELSYQGSFDYYFCKPKLELSVNVSCAASVAQGKDVTNYTIDSAIGQYSGIAPTSQSRILRLAYPRGIQPPVPDVTSGSAVVTASPIYTGTWAFTLNVTNVYTLPNGLIIQISDTSTNEFDVDCANDVCQFSGCIQNLVDSYIKAKSDNYVRATELSNMLLSLTGEYMLYSIGVSCGNEQMVSSAVAAMRSIAKATGCDCCGDGIKKTPQLVIPIGGGSGGGSGQTVSVTTTGNGIAINPIIVGQSIQYELSLSYGVVSAQLAATQNEVLTGSVANKFVTPATLKGWWESGLIGSNRVAVTDGTGKFVGQAIGTAFNKNFGSSVGNVPAIGANLVPLRAVVTDASGNLITAGAAFKYELLYSSVSDVAIVANTTEQDLKTYTLPAGTLDTNEDFIQMRAEFSVVPAGADEIYARLYFGGQNLFVGGFGIVGYNQISIVVRVYRTGATAQLFTGEGVRRSIPAALLVQQYVNTSEDLANNVVIKTTGQSVIQGRASAVVCKSLTVEIFRK
jgi:hypothetical protein